MNKLGSVPFWAKERGLSESTLRKWVDSGALPAVKTGRKRLIAEGNLDAFLNGRFSVPSKINETKRGAG